MINKESASGWEFSDPHGPCRVCRGESRRELIWCLANQCALTDQPLTWFCVTTVVGRSALKHRWRTPPTQPCKQFNSSGVTLCSRPIHPLESPDIINPLKFKFQRIFSPPAPRLAVQCVSVSVHWVEINFSTNLVIARRSFQDHVEAERLLDCRQVVVPHFLHKSAGGADLASESGLRR